MNNTTPTVAYSINEGKNKVMPKKNAHAYVILTNALTLGGKCKLHIPFLILLIQG